MITARDQGVGRLAPIRVRKLDENAVGLHVRNVDEKRGIGLHVRTTPTQGRPYVG